jgi:hypothetical protein
MKIKRSYNVQIWVGLQEMYNKEKVHTLDDVRMICDKYVNDIKDCITITPTEFRYVIGNEKGVIVGYISYPMFKRSRKEIRKRALNLAQLLMVELNQYRVTVTTPYKSYTLENNLL